MRIHTITVTVNGQPTEVTRKSENRTYSHAVVAVRESGESVCSWHSSEGLALKAAAQLRTWGATRYDVRPVDGVVERAVGERKKTRTAEQGPTPAQRKALEVLHGTAKGGEMGRVRGELERLGWIEYGPMADGWNTSQLSAAGRAVLGLSEEPVEAMLAELDALQVMVDHATAQLGDQSARGYSAPHAMVKQAGRFLAYARNQYANRNAAEFARQVQVVRDSLERTGVDFTPAAPAEPVVHAGDIVELVDGSQAKVNYETSPGFYRVDVGPDGLGGRTVRADQVVRVLGHPGSIIRQDMDPATEAGHVLAQVVGSLADLNPSLGLRFGSMGDATGAPCWYIFSSVDIGGGTCARFGGVSTVGLPELLDQVLGQDRTRGNAWRTWFAHLVGAVAPAYYPEPSFSHADLIAAL